MRHVVYFLGLSLGALALGCSSSTTDTTVIVRPELVAVSPDDFLGALPAADAAQVQSYVATLFDMSLGSDGGVMNFQLASSPATSSLLPVTFAFVVTSHRYLAEVDAYTQASQADPNNPQAPYIAPSAPGGRLQFDQNGKRVAAAWHVTCGGYAATPGDGGSYGGAGSVDEVVPADAGAAGATDFPPGVLTYDGITQTTHHCVVGLPPGTN
jgi:hypothetical protein